MKSSLKAAELFETGHSCAQAILVTFAHKLGIQEESAFAIGAGLGGGIGRTQNVCGAINAGAIVLGIKFGKYKPNDSEYKERMARMVADFMLECKTSLGSTQCLELIKVDLNNPEQKRFAQKSGNMTKTCSNAVKVVSDILDNFLELPLQ